MNQKLGITMQYNIQLQTNKDLTHGIRTCDLPGVMLYQLGYEATHWERGHIKDLALLFIT